ncbi:MAG: hypothetical protein EOP49_21365 [Sphingobacteriales bacterium]|nr:MAG: hypothetical protein EOP49_21365 [Sphingobacteriales bacterium]
MSNIIKKDSWHSLITTAKAHVVEGREGFGCQYFGTDRGKSPARLELRLPEGVRMVIPFANFTEMNFDLMQASKFRPLKNASAS